MGKNVVILGTQWGDEGKGKIVDLLTDQASLVARFQGGHNAGHTLVIDGKKTVLHLIMHVWLLQPDTYGELRLPFFNPLLRMKINVN